MAENAQIELTLEEVEFLLESLRYARRSYEHTVGSQPVYREPWYQKTLYTEKMNMFARMLAKLNEARSRLKQEVKM